MANSEKLELVEAIEPEVERLTAEHMQRRSDWYFHDIVPWERGRPPSPKTPGHLWS